MNLIECLCDQFEQSWRAGDLPELEAYLRQAPATDQPLLLERLRALELELMQEATREGEGRQFAARWPHEGSTVGGLGAHTKSGASSQSVSLVVLADVLRGCQRDELQSRAASLVELQQLATERYFAPHEYLIRQGDQADSLIVIQDGTVEIRVQQEHGTTHVIDRAGPGQVLGEMALLTNEPRTASAVALEPVRAAVLPAEAFHILVGKHPELATLLTDLIASRLGKVQRDALTGKQLDRYCIRRRLGRGGMSIVYEAIDSETNQRVALKMMSHRLVCSPTAHRRFQLEADLIERFDHPHIVKMHRRFTAFRTYFIAMEYCVGETLARHLKRCGPMDEPSFRRALGQLAKALEYAHGEGIVHRDIKPANVMRVEEGDVKLMDFGLAEPIEGESLQEGQRSGTPRYMSPEQRAGDKVDARADYFSLGCVAYEMLTGSPLFSGATDEELGRDFHHWRPPDVTRINRPISDDTVGVLRQLLAVKREDRQMDLRAITAWA